jgi:hypothetical protein
MHLLVEEYGQPGWVAALTPLSVDGMIVAASTMLLAESRSGNRVGLLPWTLLMRQVRHAAEAGTSRQRSGGVQSRPGAASSAGRLDVWRPDGKGASGRGREAQVLAWQWALANSCGDGSLPSGRDIGRQHGLHERWAGWSNGQDWQANWTRRPSSR